MLNIFTRISRSINPISFSSFVSSLFCELNSWCILLWKKEMKWSENPVGSQVFVAQHCIDLCILMHANLSVHSGSLQYLDSGLDWTLDWTMDSQLFRFWLIDLTNITVLLIYTHFMIQYALLSNKISTMNASWKCFHIGDADDDSDWFYLVS